MASNSAFAGTVWRQFGAWGLLRVPVASKLQLGASRKVQFGTSKLSAFSKLPRVSGSQFGVWRWAPIWEWLSKLENGVKTRGFKLPRLAPQRTTSGRMRGDR
jgi:hypothetical protein